MVRGGERHETWDFSHREVVSPQLQSAMGASGEATAPSTQHLNTRATSVTCSHRGTPAAKTLPLGRAKANHRVVTLVPVLRRLIRKIRVWTPVYGFELKATSLWRASLQEYFLR